MTTSQTHASRGKRRWRAPMTAAAVAVAGCVGAGVTIATDTISAQTAPVNEEQAEVFVSLQPERFLDTRIGEGVANDDPIGPGETIDVTFTGVGGVPDEATSVAINTTIPASATSQAFTTVWPTGTPRPLTSINNADPGQPVPNFSLFRLGDGGQLSVFNERGETDFVIDVVGYFIPLADVEPGALTGGELLSGAGAPDDALGMDGDAFIDTESGDFFVKAGDEFVLVSGGDGAGGDVLSGDGPPADTLGDNGDVYVDTASGEFFVKANDVFVPIGGGDGGNLLSGSGAPDDSIGDDGDVFVNTDDGQLFTKANGTFTAVGTPTTATDSAIGARNDGAQAGVDPAVDDDNNAAIDFNTVDAQFGDAITKTDIDTFTLNTAGFYEVTYRVSSDAGALSFGTQLQVAGTPVGGQNVLAAGGGQLTDTVVVQAAAGDTLELVSDDTLQVADNSSISVEFLAAS